jgi:hypothetical protein
VFLGFQMFIVIAAISLTVSIVMSGVAWRLAREERRRSRARVAALASDLAALDPAARGATPSALDPGAAPAPGLDLFRADEQRSSRSRFAAVLTVGGLAVVAALALIVVTSRGGQSISGPRVAPAPRPAARGLEPRAATEPAPLELVALGHERDRDGIIVRGVVRNPTAGVERDRLAVVVLLFDRDGGFLASGHAGVDVPGLAPGSHSDFVVTVPHANEAGRYRLSFRIDDRVLPHVDRRDRGPVAQLQ